MWYYENENFDPSEEFLEDYQGFVYVIEDILTRRKYIGKKFFWKPKILPITKTRKRRKHTRVQSDWRDYYGSNDEIHKIITESGVGRFSRKILRLCRTKSECAYYELKEQMDRDVLLKPDAYYNSFVGGKINRRHLIKESE